MSFFLRKLRRRKTVSVQSTGAFDRGTHEGADQQNGAGREKGDAEFRTAAINAAVGKARLNEARQYRHGWRSAFMRADRGASNAC